MLKTSIQSTKDNKTLFEGEFHSPQLCLEAAIQNKTDLSYANLKGLNLSNCNMDDAILDHADFSNSNLTGANISEASLKNATLQNATLVDTCLSYSDLTEANLKNARFGATDITGTDLSGSKFSSLSCFSLDFTQAKTLSGASYTHFNQERYLMNLPPKVIIGLLSTPIIILERSIIIGHQVFSYEHFNVYPFLESLIKINMQNIY